MKVFYQDETCTLYHGDMREIFPQLPLADVVIADPPYGETRHKWDRWPTGWLEHMQKVPSFWCWGSLKMFRARFAEFLPFTMAQDLVWEKQNGSSMHNDRFRRVHEFCVQFYLRRTAWAKIYHDTQREHTGAKKQRIIRSNKPTHWGQIGKCNYEVGTERIVRSVLRAKNSQRDGTNTTGKPLSILRYLIRYSCPQDGLVIDPFCGAGSTLIAARECGRRCVGVDADASELEKAVKRLRQQVLKL